MAHDYAMICNKGADISLYIDMIIQCNKGADI